MTQLTPTGAGARPAYPSLPPGTRRQRPMGRGPMAGASPARAPIAKQGAFRPTPPYLLCLLCGSALPGHRPRVAAHLCAGRYTRLGRARRPGASVFLFFLFYTFVKEQCWAQAPVGTSLGRGSQVSAHLCVGRRAPRSRAWRPVVSVLQGRSPATVPTSVFLGRGPRAPTRPRIGRLFLPKRCPAPQRFSLPGAVLDFGPGRCWTSALGGTQPGRGRRLVSTPVVARFGRQQQLRLE
ncbi:hypothetical protein NDU88_006286 [Pleurodeles waltl]|uniref:Uncharacterized protein n=1 Tax=Pleurodeles waltl TaxID=8319 RepID=A0AAV7MDH3_PLEWA|nr:hypothetical protein NDU88_006286 [Pleurodeles waltl]